MRVTTLLVSSACLALVAGTALAAMPLSESQMDGMTAGAEIMVPPIVCVSCTQSNSSSSSQNGATTKTNGGGTGLDVFFLTVPLLPHVIPGGPIIVVTMP